MTKIAFRPALGWLDPGVVTYEETGRPALSSYDAKPALPWTSFEVSHLQQSYSGSARTHFAARTKGGRSRSTAGRNGLETWS